MGLDPYSLQLSLPAGEAVARWLRDRYPQNTAKLVARDTGMDVRTVENVLAGHLSGPTITKLIMTYRSGLGLALLAAIMGQSVEQDIERELREIADERRQLDKADDDLRARYAALRARGSADGGRLRLVHPQDAGAGRQDGRAGRGVGAGPTGGRP